MSHPIITFPQPPPTSNTLTSHQRQHLLRSTRKLTKLLGSAPHLTDCDNSFPSTCQSVVRDEFPDSWAAVYLNLSTKTQSVSRSPSFSRPSYDVPRPPSPASSISSVSTTTSKAHHKNRFSFSENNAPQDDLDSSFSKMRPPILRLASSGDEFAQSFWASAKLDAAPIATDADTPLISDASDGGSTDRLVSPISPPITPVTPTAPRSYTLPIPGREVIPSPFVETSEPTFKVTSEASTRRLKMERIRKRLGECVPVDAVFPHESSDDEDEDGDYVQVITEKKPAQVNINLRPRWKSSAAVVAFDVIYECPDEHGDEGLANGLGLAPKTPKNPDFMSPESSHAAPLRQRGKLIKRLRRETRF